MIRHARLTLAAPVFLLPVAMILSAFGTLLVAAVGATSLLTPGGDATSGTAILLTAIAMFADPEHGVTSLAATNPLTHNYFVVTRHARRRAGLDNDNRSCQVRTSLIR